MADDILALKQLCKRDAPLRVSAFPDCHRPHRHPCDPSGPRMSNLSSVVILIHSRRHCTACQDEHPASPDFVDRCTNRIPKSRNLLPLINQTRIRPRQQAIRPLLSQLTIRRPFSRIGHKYRASGNLLGCRRLSAPLRPAHKNSAHIGEFLGYQTIRYSLLIFSHSSKIVTSISNPCQ